MIRKQLLLVVSIFYGAIIFGQKAAPLFVYDFELNKFNIADRLDFLKNTGFSGVTFPVHSGSDLATLDQYLTVTSRKGFIVPAVFSTYDFTPGNNNQQLWKALTDKVKGKGIKVSMIYKIDSLNRGNFKQQDLISKVKEMAGYMAKSKVELVIYPHDNTLIESMTESVEIIKATGSSNVYTSFHLCHELRAGNARNLLAIGRKCAPYIKLASISGADYMAPYKHTPDWSDAIKPLYMGSFDTQEFVQVLAQIGFTGPVFLHTFGIKEPGPEEHLSKSLIKWKEISSKVDQVQKADITKTLDAPESAYYDKGSQAWYISSLGGGSVTLEEDNYGWITKLDRDGKILNSRWVEGLHAPTGMASVGNKLYVGDRGCLVEIDIANAKILRKIPLANSQFVNDVAAAPNGDIYVSDTFTNTIYCLSANGKIDVFYTSDYLEYPNGLWIDGNQLIIGTWGPMTNRTTFETSRKGTLKKLDLRTKKLTNVGAGLPIANIDAVVKYGSFYYVSDWTGGRLLRVDETGKVKVMLTGYNQFADFGIDLERGIIMMPEMSTGKVFTINVEQL